MDYRIGNGIDAHKLESGIPLIIGGINIPFLKGSRGHSDGDVLIHSIVDALLGSLALGDIGKHFPSNNSRWKNAKSKIFLEHVYNLIKNKGFILQNLDSTIILQEPPIADYILNIREKIASILLTNIENISIKATTTDQLGFIGNGDGIASITTVIIKKIDVD